VNSKSKLYIVLATEWFVFLATISIKVINFLLWNKISYQQITCQYFNWLKLRNSTQYHMTKLILEHAYNKNKLLSRECKF